MVDASNAVSRLARPEYTGENRCRPCTVANVAIAIGLATGLAAVVSVPVGALALAAFLSIIYLRGYLVPGTPALTRRYFPERVLAWFGKEPDRGRAVTIETADLDAIVDALSAADVVRREGDSLRLTAAFRRRWRDRLETVGEADGTASTPETADIARTLDGQEVDRLDDATVEVDGRRLVRWESEAALAADVAADRELRERLDAWSTLDPDDRTEVLAGLRLLRERCPACEGELATTVDRLEHCCRRPRIAVDGDCEECGRPIVSLALTESAPLLEWVPERDVPDA